MQAMVTQAMGGGAGDGAGESERWAASCPGLPVAGQGFSAYSVKAGAGICQMVLARGPEPPPGTQTEGLSSRVLWARWAWSGSLLPVSQSQQVHSLWPGCSGWESLHVGGAKASEGRCLWSQLCKMTNMGTQII